MKSKDMKTQNAKTSAETLMFAGRRAHGMARALAEQIVASDIPQSHWDEVLERLKELLGHEEVWIEVASDHK